MIKKLLIIFCVIVLLFLAVSTGAYYYFIKAPLPVTEGEIVIRGIHAPVRVLRDAWGVPHIYAENDRDLMFAQGFVQAQDRLWQMEINRRLAAGRLSEVIGEDALPVDRLLRTLGLMKAARLEFAACSPEERKLFQAFCDGINAYIESRISNLPLEFRLLGVKPEPWIPEHSIGWAKVMSFLGSKNWQEEIVRAMVIRKVGAEKARTLFNLNRPGTPFILPEQLDLSSFLPAGRTKNEDFFPSLGGASNNWVVHGSRTDTGQPLLANDMHLDVRIPSVWYEIHLSGGGLDVIGLSLPGVPLIIAGHNRDLAWGITFAYNDVQDLFLERLNSEGPVKYLYKGTWEPATITEELIKVKGRDEPVTHSVIETVHGPIISSQIPAVKGDEYALALKWSGHEPGGMISALRGLNMSRDLEEFKDAALKWPDPAINLVCADRKGDIGYVLAGRIPIRPLGGGCGPFEGWTGEHDWTGYIPEDKKPFLLNPERGFIATANSRVAGKNSPYYISDDYLPGFRLARIQEVLSEKSPVSREDFRLLQGDFKSMPAARFLKSIEDMEGKDPRSRDLLTMLRSWDQRIGPESSGGAIYSVLFSRLLENTFRDEMEDVADLFLGNGLTPLNPLSTFVTHSRVILLNLMSDPQSPWFDDISTPGREGLHYILEKSLKETFDFLKNRIGPEPFQWRWGLLHKMEIKHPLGQVKPLDRIFNIGPFESGGHFSTVWQSTLLPGTDYNYRGWTASNRHIYDLQEWDRSLGSIVPGQSGMYGSPHYSDQFEMWLGVEYHPLHFSKEKVEAEARQRLILKP